MKNVVWILFLILFVIGCNQQSQKVNAKLKISTANLVAGQNGGTMLYITNKARNAQRSIPVQDNEITVVLEDGPWDFAVVSWAGGNGPLSGTLKCAKATKNLTSADSTIFLQLAEATCDDAFFSPATYRAHSSVSKINPLRIIDCNNIASAGANNTCSSTSGLIGTSNSYRVRLLAYTETPNGGLPNLNFNLQPAITSDCINIDPVGDSLTPTNLQIPFGGTGVKTSVVIETFSLANCSSPGRKFYFPQGFSGAETTLSNAATHPATGGLGDVFVETGVLTISGSFGFPNTTENTFSPAQTFNITNNHSQTFTLTTSITGGGFAYNSGTFPGHSDPGACSSTLAPGSSCTIKLKFAPVSTLPAGGLYNSTLTLNANAGGTNYNITRTLTGTGLSVANISFTPSGSINFPDTIQGTSSAPQVITLTNSGGVAANALNISLGGTNPGAYSLTSGANQCGSTLNGNNSSCNLYVVFQPAALQTSTTASLNISYNNGNSSINLSNTHNLSGNGVPLFGGTLAGMSNFSYASTVIGTGTPPTQSFTIINNTTSNLSISSISLSVGSFNIQAGSPCPSALPHTLAPTSSCTFNITFNPSSTSVANGTITVIFNDSATGTIKSIQKTVSGSGLTPANLSASAGSLSFGSTLYNSYKLATLTLQNNGDYQASFITPSFSGTHAASFTQHSTTCNSPVLPSSNCQIVIKFTPPSNTGTYSASVQVSYARGTTTNGTTSSINLSGSAIELHVANGEVKTMIKNGTNKLIIGGSFDRIGPRSGGGVLLEKYSSNGCSGTNCFLSSTSGLTSFPKIEGTVNVAIPDGSSGYYIGGKFKKVGSTAVSNIAHISSTGSVDTNFNPSINDEVEALYFNGTYLFVGGKFTSIGGTGRTAFALLSTNGTLQTPSLTFTAPTGQTPSIKTIYPSGSGSFYIGGLFNSVNSNTNIKNIAKITSGNAVDSTFILKIGSASDDFVKTIASDVSKIYVGGKFTQATTHNNSTYNPRNGIASYDLMLSYPSLDNDYFYYDSGAIINKILFSGSSLYVGGLFTSTNGANFAKYSNLSGITISTFSISPNSAIYDIALDGSNLYLGGSFTAIGTTPLAGMAVINGSTLSSTYSPLFNKTVKCIAFNSSSLYAGGDFSSLGGVERKNLAEIDLTTGAPTTFNIVTNGTVNALVSNGTNIFMGGDFTSAGPTGNLQTRNRYAVFTPSGTLQNANPSFNNSINSLLISGSYLYIGGAFNDVNNGTTLNGLARINHSNWGLDTSFNAALNSGAVVKSLAVVGSVLYMGGSIASINGNSQTNLAAVNLSTGLNTSFAPSLSAGGTINQLIPKTGSNYIYVSGNFSLIGGQTRTHLALLDTATTYGDAVGGFAPTIDSEVKGIAFTNNGLYAVGNFTTINSNPRKGFANLDVINGSLFSTEEGHTELKTLLEDTDQMFLGGGFGEVKGQYRSGLSVLGK